MFDVNPTAHAYYLRDLDRSFAVCRRQALSERGNAGAKRRSIPVVTVCIFLTVTLATVISGGLTL